MTAPRSGGLPARAARAAGALLDRLEDFEVGALNKKEATSLPIRQTISLNSSPQRGARHVQLARRLGNSQQFFFLHASENSNLGYLILLYHGCILLAPLLQWE